jgi:hypothetical protein
VEFPVINTFQSVLCREIVAVYSHIHTKHINTLCGQNVELSNLNMVVFVHVVICGLYMFKLVRFSCRCGGSANRLSQTSVSGDSPIQCGLLG